MTKRAETDHPIQPLLAERWSPYGFDSRPVPDEDLRSLLEAARWAASSYNEQPWSFVLARREDPGEFERLLSCLLEGNRTWAREAPVLAIAVTKRTFARNGKPNKAAEHDLGLATGNLTVEATARGLSVHAMIGIDPDRAREVYGIPDDADAFTGLAIGYAAPDPGALPAILRERERSPRARKPLADFVFAGSWGRTAPVVG